MDSKLNVLIKIVQANPEIQINDIEEYFDKHKKLHCDVKSIVHLGGQNFKLELNMPKGCLAMLTRGDHKLKGHSLKVELLSEKPVHSPGSGITPNDQQCPLRSEKTRELPKSVKVTGLPTNLGSDEIEVYFETEKSGGRKGSIKKCVIEQNGVAFIEFFNPEVAASVVSKGGHSLYGYPLVVQYVSTEQKVNKCKLLMTQLPSEIETDYLKALLEKTLGTDQFSLEMPDNTSVVLIFHKVYTDAEIEDFVTKLQSKKLKGANLKVEQIHVEDNSIPHADSADLKKVVSTSVKVTGLPTNLGSDEIEVYFETEKSGGRKGSIKKCVIEENGVAFIEFDSPEVADCVVSKGDHKLFGCPLLVQYVSTEQKLKECKLFVTQLPAEIEMDYLKLLLEKVIGTDEFSLEQQDSTSAMVIFQRMLPDNELKSIITKIESKKLLRSNLKVLYEDPHPVMDSVKTVSTTVTSGYRRMSSVELSLVKSNTGSRDVLLGDAGSTSVPKHPTPSTQQVLITNVPSIDAEYLQLVLEKGTKLQYGNDFLLEQRTDTSAVVTLKKFLSPAELNSFVENANKIIIKNTNLKAEVHVHVRENESPVQPQEFSSRLHESTDKLPESTSRLLVLELPQDIIHNYLKSIIEKAASMTIGKGISLEVIGSKAAVIFDKSISDKELENIITNIQKQWKKGKSITATQLKSSNCIVVSNIDDQYYDEQFLLNYFENQKRSGGGAVESVKLCGNGKAMIVFQNQDVVSHVLNTSHKYSMKLTEVDPLEAFKLWCTAVEPHKTLCSTPEIETRISLTPENFVFVSQTKYSNISKAFPLLSVRFASPNIIVNGPPSMVQKLQNELPTLSSHKSVATELQLFFPFLKTEVGTKLLQDFIRGHNCSAVVYIADNSIHLLCEDDAASIESAVGAAAAVQKELLCKRVPISKSQCKELQELCQTSLMVDQKIHIQFGSDQLTLTGFKDDVSSREEMLRSLMKKKGELSMMTVTIQTGVWKLLQSRNWWNSEIVVNAQISVVTSDSKTVAITICGQNDIVQKVSSKIAAFKSSIKNVSVNISKPAHLKYFESSSANHLVSQIESQYNVSIEIQLVSNISAQAASMSSNEIHVAGSSNDSCKNVSIVCTREQKKIAVWTGDITKFKSDVMVNAANEDLRHIGGVALAIANKGGRIIQDTCDAYIREHRGPLKEGEVFFSTDVGSLPCRAVVHAVGPRWRGGWNNEEKNLFSACLNSLIKAGQYTSIVLPAISGGIFGYPFSECAETLLKAAIEFSNKYPSSSLHEINFILSSQLDAKKFVDVVQRYLSNHKLVPADAAGSSFPNAADNSFPSAVGSSFPNAAGISFPNAAGSSFPNAAGSSFPNAAGSSFPNAAGSSFPNATGSSFPNATGSSIIECVASAKHCPKSILDCLQLIKGDLVDVQADVYVNSTKPELDLTSGQISVALSKAAGPSLAHECSRKATTGRKLPGEVIITEAGRLKCKHVFHVVLKSYEGFGNIADEIFKKAIHNCLELCVERNYSSIAFPPLGTGAFGFPISVAAKLMINEAVQFFATHKQCSLTNIYFVNYTDIEFGTFRNELKHYQSTAAEAFGVLDRTLSDERRQENSTFCIKGQVVEIVYGDITDEQTDVIVNSTNREMKLNAGAVSAALLKKAGPIFQHQCDEYISHGVFPVTGGIVVMTTCGDLKCKAVFQTIFQLEQLEVTILNCLRQAVDRGYVSISFPALGTGQHASSPVKTALAMIEAIRTFCNTSVLLKVIRVVIFQAEMYKSFLDIFQHSDFSTISTTTILDTKTLQPAGNGPEEITGNLETACFNIFGESLQIVESAAQELKKVGSTTASSGVDEIFPMHLQDSENQQDKCQTMTLQPDSVEYKSVFTRFYETQPQSLICQIVEVCHIVNQALLGKYSSKRAELNRSGNAKEMNLFFGTDVHNYSKIKELGFNTGSPATVAYGKGVHFYRDAARVLSPTYSPPDPNGYKYVYLARVLIGDFTFGRYGMVAPPSKPSNPHAFYDSVVNNTVDPSIFVIFNSSQAYPQYLIKLKWSSLV